MKYIAKAKLKYVLVKDKDKSTGSKTIYKIYDAKDTYSGVHYAEGGLTDAEYVSKRNSIVIDTSGNIIEDKKSGVWLKESAKPVGSIDENNALKLKSATDWENYLKGESGSAEVELSPTRISKGFYGWKAKTETKSKINGYDWEIVTMKRSNGKLVSDIQGGKIIKGDGYSSFGYTPTDDPSATLIVTMPKIVNEKRVREQHEQAVAQFKKMVAEGRLPKKQYAKGGEMSNVHVIKDNYTFRQDEPKRVYHNIEGMYGSYWFVAKTDNSYKHGYGSNGINRGCVYKLDVWRGGNPVGRDKSTKGGHVSEDYIAGYFNKWDVRPKTKEAKEVVSGIVEWLENNICDLKRNWSSVKFAKGGEMANFNGAGIFAGGGKVNDSFDYEKFVNSSNGEALAMLRKHYGNEIMGEDFHGFGNDELMDKAENKFLDLVNKGLLLQNADGETLTPRPFKTNIVIDLQSNETKEFDDKTEAFKYAKKATREGWDVVDINAYVEDDSDPTSWSNESNRYVATRKENLMRAFRNFRGNFKPETPKSSLYGYGNFADGGRMENISPVIKPKIEAIEKILPKALGEGGYMTIIFAFQTKDGYAFNMESKSDYPVNRATPKLKRIGVVVERTGEKGKRLITIPKSVFDQMTTIYMVGGEFADGGIQNHPLNIQIHTKIAEELGREMAARFIINDYSRDSGIGAVRLIEMAIQKGFISLDEINSDIINSAEEQADESAEMEEIGSSDTNIMIHSMLKNAGIEMDYEGNRMVRKYSTPEEANIKSSTHKNEK